ncbi:glycosyltransferase [Desulfovibrio cuneatus]|uniref:glycosyltransferase n=1 Tax=Desulfovibrio cuneatus TaxID=159728 RepID=UPI00041A9E4C|nr:glycosyltransferase family 2 protein [Desulfovibrio cuneatus]
MSEYAVIIPTLNEAGNVSILVERLEKVLQGLDWEAIFVDDSSTDGTLAELHALAVSNRRVRYLRRIGRRGLASACIEGMMSTAATYIAVMDADLQHDESKLTDLFGPLASGEATVTVASRYTGDGGTGSWDKKRVGMSKLATWFAQHNLTAACSDPMSGFFALHRSIIDAAAPKVQSRGFKILFDVLTIPGLPVRVKEVPYTFRERTLGSTKLSYSVIVDFLWLLLSKYVGRLFNLEFVMFCIIGLLGVLVHMGVLFVVYRQMDFSFLVGQTAASLCAMTSNFLLNNRITFEENKLTGSPLILGYCKFVAACSLGMFVNIAVSDYLLENGMFWLFAAGTGTVIASVVNFFFARFFIWRLE